MRFLFLIESELNGIKVRWSKTEPKTADIIEAAQSAGFTEVEIKNSPLGTLEADYQISATEIAKRGSVVLIGMNGSILLECAG